MGIKKKIARALSQALGDVYVQLSDNGRITGFVVSPRFKGMDALERQQLVEDILDDPSAGLSPRERDRVLMIAPVEPVEYHSVGAPIQISRIRARAGGTVEVVLYGNLPDADFVRKAFQGQNGIRTTEPKPVASAPGQLVSFRAKGSKAKPLSLEKTIRLLKGDKYIEVLRNA